MPIEELQNYCWDTCGYMPVSDGQPVPVEELLKAGCDRMVRTLLDVCPVVLLGQTSCHLIDAIPPGQPLSLSTRVTDIRTVQTWGSRVHYVTVTQNYLIHELVYATLEQTLILKDDCNQ